MPLIRRPLNPEEITGFAASIPIPAPRRIIEKLRWRTAAEDGTDFAFDLSSSLNHGDAVWIHEGKLYRVQQLPESALHLRWPHNDHHQIAHLAWNLGNLHQPIEIRADGIYVAEDPAVRSKLSKLGYAFEACETIFRPAAGAAHGHHH